jgi:hypothetical protein
MTLIAGVTPSVKADDWTDFDIVIVYSFLGMCEL